MIGYFIEQELGNLVPAEKRLATVLTMTEVDPADPAFEHPTRCGGGDRLDWGTPQQRAVTTAHPDALDPAMFPAGSMGPKVEAAAQFTRASGHPAVIGSLEQLTAMLAGNDGTRISDQVEGMGTR